MMYDPSGMFSQKWEAVFKIALGFFAGDPVYELINDGIAEGAYSIAAPIILEFVDYPVTKAFIEYSLSCTGGEIHNQHLLPGYHPIMRQLADTIIEDAEWREIVINNIDKSNFHSGDQTDSFDDNRDLFLSLHNFNYWISIEPRGNHRYVIHAVIWDDFNFDYSWIEKNGYSIPAIANDIGLYNQESGYMTPFHFWLNFGYEMIY